jgi:DNA-directed RNA polymerase sigma subunit (sigma70/sigma32)
MTTNIEKKIDEIFSRLDEIEKRVGIQPKKLSDFMDEAYSVKDASKILGCTMEKVRQFIKYDFLDTFRVGRKIMITSESIKRLMENNKSK